jgi:hypothetical protein
VARKTAKALKPFPDLPWLVEKARAFQAFTNEEKATILAIEATPTDPLLRVVVACLKAEAEADAAYAALDAIRLDDRRPSGLAKGVTPEEFQAVFHESERAHFYLARAVDAWQGTARVVKAEEARRADPAESNVEKATAKSLIAEALSESGAEIQWSVKSVGLIAHKLTEAVYGYVVREEAQEPPLCRACA